MAITRISRIVYGDKPEDVKVYVSNGDELVGIKSISAFAKAGELNCYEITGNMFDPFLAQKQPIIEGDSVQVRI